MAALKSDHETSTVVVRVNDKRYALISEASTRVGDEDISGPVGSFTEPPRHAAWIKHPWVAYAVHGLDPARYVALRTDQSTVTVDIGTVGRPDPRQFQTTGWALAIAEGTTSGTELCPYLRSEFKSANACPAGP